MKHTLSRFSRLYNHIYYILCKFLLQALSSLSRFFSHEPHTKICKIVKIFKYSKLTGTSTYIARFASSCYYNFQVWQDLLYIIAARMKAWQYYQVWQDFKELMWFCFAITCYKDFQVCQDFKCFTGQWNQLTPAASLPSLPRFARISLTH